MSISSCTFWSSYWGLLSSETFGTYKYEVYGFENLSKEHEWKTEIEFNRRGTLWGFLQAGTLRMRVSSRDVVIEAGEWFCVPLRQSTALELGSRSRLWATFSDNPSGLASRGGPVEEVGRLRYIDGCTDTLLYCPPVMGEPCLNLLHFPKGIDQSTHYHPSFRSGIIHRGSGICVSATETLMNEGTIFFLRENSRHKFRTEHEIMDVISFHPDSDWGPQHENHPMINRTWGTNDESSS